MNMSYPLPSFTIDRVGSDRNRFVPRIGAFALWNYLGFASASCAAAGLGLGASSRADPLIAFGGALLTGVLAVFAWRRAWRMIGGDQPA